VNLQNLEQARFNMIEQQIRPWDVADSAVLGLLSTVKREEFVPTSYKGMAFADMAIPLGSGQAMLPPRVQARLLQDAAVQTGDKVLEIGAGSGFMTALLANQAQRVISLELSAELADCARANLQRAGVRNAEIRQADGAGGAPADGPFDVILLGGSVVEVPHTLLAQLKIGGRLVGIVGDEPIMHACVITRTSENNFKTDEKWDDNAPRLQNFPQPSGFKF
jgi:protein-L-isoaspartate(D-aspartate) O-methyltransferase